MATHGMTGQTLAEKTGMHRVTISHILNNRVDPKPETIAKIATALNMSPEAIGYGES